MAEVIQKIYRKLLPESVRGLPLVAKLKQQLLGHDFLYDQGYYDRIVEGPAVKSSVKIAESIINDFHPASAADVGCGTGALLERLREGGCTVFGLEYAEAGLAYCRSRNLDVQKFDLEKEVLKENRVFDVAISMEVAEHLPAEVADRYVDLLTSLSGVVIFTAAPVGQGGHDHVNEQPASYWIEKFKARGLWFDEERSERWKADWRATPEVVAWYHKNLMIFLRR